MRLPTEAQLSREQREVCTAPPTDTSLVVGPPGSGKTVAAIFRKKYLENLDENVVAAAWNNVLSKFSGMSQTFETWHNDWWQKATGNAFPKIPIEGKKMKRPDYQKAHQLALTTFKDQLLNKGNWGHLILDEAQDFSGDAHSLFATVQSNSVQNAKKPSSLLILADENQRITENNSAISEICNKHFLVDDDIYYLKENYRNTQEIAKVAREFYVDLESGIPELPERTGNKPKLLTSCSIDDAVTRIANHAKTFKDFEIGVLVFYEKTRYKLFNKLNHRLQGTGINVQTYSSKFGAGKKLSEQMTFDKQGVVTVLCFASAKGVEFDSVFMPELQQMPALASIDEDHSKMYLYVMTSRARSQLTMMFDDSPRESKVWELFPDDDKLKELFDID